MLFENIALLDENFKLREGMFVGVSEGKIDYIGKEAPPERGKYLKEGGSRDGARLLLIPAFYNTHAHSAMTLMRGYGEGLQLQDWLETRIFPFEAKLSADAVYWATKLALAESLASGIVSTSDMYYFCGDVARAALDCGVKMNISRSVVHFDDSDPKKGERYRDMCAFIEEYHNAGGGRILAEACIHAEYTSNAAAVRAVGDAAIKYGVGLQVHVSETRKEHEECRERHGKTPVKYLSELGLFDTRATAAHCVWLDDEDFDILAAKKVGVASCAVSNMKLASGIAEVQKMLDKGINVSVGTDSVASNNNLNFFEEMKLLALAQKIRTGDPASLSPEAVLRMATRRGALVQGREDCGLVKEGYRADLVAIDTRRAEMQPMHDIKTALVYSASSSSVVMTMCDGEVLYENGEYKTLDIERTMYETRVEAEKILGML